MTVATGTLLLSSIFGLAFPFVVAQLLDSVNHAGSAGSLNRRALILTCIFLAQAAFTFVHSYMLATIGEHIVYDLRIRLYDKLQSLSLDFFANRRLGELVSRLTNDVTQMRNVLTSQFASFLSQTISLLGAMGIVLYINPRLTFFILAIVPAMIAAAVILGSRIENGSKRVQDELAGSVVVAEEALQGIRVVKGFGREEFEAGRFAAAAQGALQSSVRQAVYNSLFGSLIMFLCFASIGAIMWYAGREALAGRLSLAMITGFLMYSVIIATSLSGLAGWYGQMRAAMGGIQRVFQILDLKPSVRDSAGAVRMPAVQGRIRFEHVSFCYLPGQPVLRGIDLEIQAGETLALVGPSGAGKSTLLNLIPRFYDPTSGTVRMDAMDLRSVTQSSLRAQLAIVPQETILFGGTIRENIVYGRLDATDSEVVAAAKQAHAHEFIMALPGKYLTPIGGHGVRLSGGQRQRIAVARAILRNARILLLDEATNSLDSESEKLVQDALSDLMRGRTTVVIAHRLSTVRSADRIAVMDSGAIAELGSHQELMRLDGIYRRFHAMQFRHDSR
jgi:subfamily B ATP-binding cassette protein MsbA